MRGGTQLPKNSPTQLPKNSYIFRTSWGRASTRSTETRADRCTSQHIDMAEEKKGIISCELIDLLNKDPVLQFKERKAIPNINIKGQPFMSTVNIKPTVNDDSEESLRRNRFLPSSDDESDKPNGARGGATRAMRRDLEETGLLPADALRIIKEFATGK